MLEAVEIGNEPDLYANNGLRDNTWNVQQYVTQYVRVLRIPRESGCYGTYFLL
jgi:hypothetical protein